MDFKLYAILLLKVNTLFVRILNLWIALPTKLEVQRILMISQYFNGISGFDFKALLFEITSNWLRSTIFFHNASNFLMLFALSNIEVTSDVINDKIELW